MKKFNKKLFSFGAGSDADWRIILVFTIILAAIAILLNALAFFTLSREAELGSGSNTEVLTLNLEEVKKTTSYYQNKEVKGEAILNGQGSIVSDPSI